MPGVLESTSPNFLACCEARAHARRCQLSPTPPLTDSRTRNSIMSPPFIFMCRNAIYPTRSFNQRTETHGQLLRNARLPDPPCATDLHSAVRARMQQLRSDFSTVCRSDGDTSSPTSGCNAALCVDLFRPRHHRRRARAIGNKGLGAPKLQPGRQTGETSDALGGRREGIEACAASRAPGAGEIDGAAPAERSSEYGAHALPARRSPQRYPAGPAARIGLVLRPRRTSRHVDVFRFNLAGGVIWRTPAFSRLNKHAGRIDHDYAIAETHCHRRRRHRWPDGRA